MRTITCVQDYHASVHSLTNWRELRTGRFSDIVRCGVKLLLMLRDSTERTLTLQEKLSHHEEIAALILNLEKQDPLFPTMYRIEKTVKQERSLWFLRKAVSVFIEAYEDLIDSANIINNKELVDRYFKIAQQA